MQQTTKSTDFEKLISDQLELLRGAENWSPFYAISRLTTDWIVNYKPTRKKLIDTLLVNPEQLFNVIMIHESKSSIGHTRTWSHLAIAHFYRSSELRAMLRNADQTIDGSFILYRLMEATRDTDPCAHTVSEAFDHLHAISYSSRVPESYKKKTSIKRIGYQRSSRLLMPLQSGIALPDDLSHQASGKIPGQSSPVA